MAYITTEDDSILTELIKTLHELERDTADHIFDPSILKDQTECALIAGRVIAYKQILQLITDLWHEHKQTDREEPPWT